MDKVPDSRDFPVCTPGMGREKHVFEVKDTCTCGGGGTRSEDVNTSFPVAGDNGRSSVSLGQRSALSPIFSPSERTFLIFVTRQAERNRQIWGSNEQIKAATSFPQRSKLCFYQAVESCNRSLHIAALIPENNTLSQMLPVAAPPPDICYRNVLQVLLRTIRGESESS